MSSTKRATLYRQNTENIGKNGVQIVKMSNIEIVVMLPSSYYTGFIQGGEFCEEHFVYSRATVPKYYAI